MIWIIIYNRAHFILHTQDIFWNQYTLIISPCTYFDVDNISSISSNPSSLIYSTHQSHSLEKTLN